MEDFVKLVMMERRYSRCYRISHAFQPEATTYKMSIFRQDVDLRRQPIPSDI